MKVALRIDGGGVLQREGDAIRLGRAADCEVNIDPAAYPTVSALHARIEPAPGGARLVHLSRSNKTLLNGEVIDATAPLRPGDSFRLGYTGPTIGVVAIESDSSGLGFESTQVADARQLAMLRNSMGVDRFEVGEGGVIGRDPQAAKYRLDHPNVSRLHASLAVDEGRVILADLGSANGTFVNGERISRPTALQAGDRVDIGPYSLKFDGRGLAGRSRSNNVELVARGLGRVVNDRSSGQPLALLEGIDLVIRPREFVCVLGPSGSGKSTLLAILSGRSRPDSGSVGLNGLDLHDHFEALKEDIAVVPQKDLLHDALPVARAIGYTAELRLPPDLDRAEVGSSVGEILGIVGLSHRSGTPIRHLSGGQLKRASLANELVARPTLLFLDEVTSGLDEQTDREVMELFREVADGGKTVVCITHNLANVEATCHLVAILAEGGRLAFFGTAEEAKAYFRIDRLGDVYRKLADRPAGEWADRFRTSVFREKYIGDRMPAAPPIPGSKGGVRPGRRPSAIRQASILARRYVATWQGNLPALIAMLGQSVLIALLLVLVFGRLGDSEWTTQRVLRTTNLQLLLVVSAFWFGCNASAKELVKERAIFLRERAFNLRSGPYLLSKGLVLLAIGVAQATLLFLIVRFGCSPAGPGLGQWAVLASMAIAGTCAGLLISAASPTEEMATALVPIAVIPQIVLAGVIAPLNGLSHWLAKGLITSYWGQQAMERLLPEVDQALLNREPQAWTGPLLAVAIQAAAMALGAFVVQARRR
ncbi:MAG: FHA domain-containing protein [Isosphaeraceae bacterium]